MRNIGKYLRVGRSGGGGFLDEDGEAGAQGGGGEVAVLRRPDGHADGVQISRRDEGVAVGVAVRHPVTIADQSEAFGVHVGEGGEADGEADELGEEHFAGMRAAADPADARPGWAFHARTACRAARRKAAECARSASSSCAGGRHWASGTESRSSVRRKGSSVIGPS